MPPVDLTPFGFTPTEAAAYSALVELGPASGYAVAKRLGIARANAYQALDGLVTKGAAALLEGTPRRYRALHPQALLTLIIEHETRKLDRLERQVTAQPPQGAEPLIELRGERAVREAATRAIVRADGPVRCVGRPADLRELGPAFRARAAAGRPFTVWSVGTAEGVSPAVIAVVEPERMAGLFASPAFLLIADGALAATLEPEILGYWATTPLVVGLVDAAITILTGA